jgi:serine/threonine-protein kinase
MPLIPGQVLHNRYRVARLLGKGGMGAVYRAWDIRLDVPVAIKEMVPQPGLDTDTLTLLRGQFEQEAKVLARLKHLHLVSVTNFFEEEKRTYLIMEFVEGDSLADYIMREGAVPEGEVLSWADQLLDALTYCHAQGIIHRDVKPQNVIIRPQGDVVLVDFGLVKLWDPTDPQTRTVMRGLGTPEYAPPEQYSARLGHTGPRSDLYSLGATLYHALSGVAPLSATDRMADPEHFAPLRELNPAISEETATVVMKSLEMARSQRWQTAEAMRNALPPSPPRPAPAEKGQDAPPPPTRGGTVKMEAAAEPSQEPQPPPVAPEPVKPPAKEQTLAKRLTRLWGYIPRPLLWLLPLLLLLVGGLWLSLESGLLSSTSSTLFTSTRGGRWEIYRLTNEGETQRITSTPRGTGSWAPEPTRGGLLFTSDRNGKREIYRLTREGETQQVTSTPGSRESWDPVDAARGGTLFTSNRSGKREIYRLTSEGEIQRITYTPGSRESWGAAMIPGALLFTSDRSGKREIYRLTDEGETQRVTSTPGSHGSWGPATAPRGALLFTSDRSGKREIYRLTGEGETQRVTYTPGSRESWAPVVTSGGDILFTSDRSGKRELYRLTGEGETQQVTSTPGSRESWSGLE